MDVPAPLTVQDEWTALLNAAQEGDDVALGRICEQLRDYLLLTADDDLCNDLRAKIGASDIVQQTMLEACRDFQSFRGNSETEFRVWIKRLAHHNLVDAARMFRKTESRDVAREVSIDAGKNEHQQLVHRQTASRIVRRRETDEELLHAVARLPENRRRIVELRHRDGLSYAQIAIEMGISETAARKLWSRTLQTLQQELSAYNEGRPIQPR